MNKEYEELVDTAARYLYELVHFAEWDKLDESWKQSWRNEARRTLALETDTCRIAVVKKNAELPKLKSLTGEASLEEKAAFLSGVKETQETMTRRNFVQEVVNEKK